MENERDDILQEKFSLEEIQEAGLAIKQAKRIAVISPKNLDGDSLGACCALHIVMKRLGKQSALLCEEDIPDNMKFIPSVHEFSKEFTPEQFDLVILPDCAEEKLIGFQDKHHLFLGGEKTIINIDHHISNKYYGTINIVKPRIATATMVVFKLLRFWNIQITPDIATSLMVGVYTDTGSFMHSNTNDEVFRIAGKLLSYGANLRMLVKSIFKTTPIKTLRLWGTVLSRVRQNDRKITVSYVTENDFEQLGAKPEDLTGIVDYINSVPDSYFSLLLTEFGGKIKGSLRTLRDDINLSKIAEVFGGGGHAKAAGFTMPGKLVVGEYLQVQPQGA